MHPRKPTHGCCPASPWGRYLRQAAMLPFFVLAAASWPQGHWQDVSQDALLTYAALILTSIGVMLPLAALFASGHALRRHLSLGWSVLPALAGWIALLLPSLLGAMVLLAGYGLNYMKDRAQSGVAVLPAWYLPTRFCLTGAASVALLLGAAAMMLATPSFTLPVAPPRF